MHKLILVTFLAALLLSACGTAVEEPAAPAEGDSTLVTVYRAPT